MARNKSSAFKKYRTFNIDNPIKKSTRDGIFKMTDNSLDKYKSNLYTLIFTNVGQRPMFPEFGTIIPNLLFEPIDDQILEQIYDEIVTKAKIWVPEIEITQIIFDDKETNLDNNKISMTIKFRLKKDETIQDFIEIEMGM